MAQKTFVDGDVLTASDLNTYCAGEGGAWQSHTPTLAQGASTDITKTVTYSKYARYGRTIVWNFWISATASGTSGSGVTLTLPVTASATEAIVGHGRYYDDNASGAYICTLLGASTGTLTFYANSVTGVSVVGVAPALAVQSADLLTGTVIYEAAS